MEWWALNLSVGLIQTQQPFRVKVEPVTWWPVAQCENWFGSIQHSYNHRPQCARVSVSVCVCVYMHNSVRVCIKLHTFPSPYSKAAVLHICICRCDVMMSRTLSHLSSGSISSSSILCSSLPAAHCPPTQREPFSFKYIGFKYWMTWCVKIWQLKCKFNSNSPIKIWKKKKKTRNKKWQLVHFSDV